MVEKTNDGHRARLRERFSRNGITSLHDHETIELLLTYVVARQDTKAIAKRLLARFHSVGGVLNADISELAEVAGVGTRSALLFALVRDLASYCLRERLQKRSVIANRSDVDQYLRFAFGARRDEYVAVLFLDAANRVITADVVSEGTVNQCVIYPRDLIKRALTVGAAGIILAHNHPAGTLQPSEADWLMTVRLHKIGKLLEIPLLDHIIICRDDVQSLRELPRWPRR